MHAIIRPLTADDEPFLWQALYYAAHMEEEGATSPSAAKSDPNLIRYVKDWGQRPGDLGFLALDPHNQQPIGAAWLRLLIGPDQTIAYINDSTPELAIAVLPGYHGKGLGTRLLTHILETARHLNTLSTHNPSTPPTLSIPAIALSVRATNPAKRLYERMGFVVVGTTTNRVGTESLIMLIRFI